MTNLAADVLEPEAQSDNSYWEQTADLEEMWDLASDLGGALKKRPDLYIDHESGFENEQIDAFDYDETEAFVYKNIKSAVDNACNKGVAWATRKKAITWIFQSSTRNRADLAFSESCQALGARAYVMQARVQYALYKNALALPEPMPSEADGLPESLLNEAIHHAGIGVIGLAQFIWDWPGVRADILARNFTDIDPGDFFRMLDAMESVGLIAIKHGHWYFISRNPDVQARDGRFRFEWSKLFWSN